MWLISVKKKDIFRGFVKHFKKYRFQKSYFVPLQLSADFLIKIKYKVFQNVVSRTQNCAVSVL